jgi:hypothetical protein
VATTDIGIELMRQYHEGSQAEPTEVDRASSITPSARTDRRAIGISQTFSRVTPPGGVAARRSEVSLPPASPELPQARQRAATQNGLESAMTILLVVVMLAAGAVVAYFALT